MVHKEKEILLSIIAESYYNIINDDNNNEEWNSLCKNKTKKEAIDNLKTYIISNKKSYPTTNTIIHIDNNEINTNFNTFTGYNLDIVSGLIYLKNKYNNLMTALSDDFVINDEIIYYHKKQGIFRNQKDFFNFEIYWVNYKLFFPNNFSNLIQTFIKSKLRFYIITINIELFEKAHVNILFFDKLTNEIERFEPAGKDYPIGFNYNNDLLDFQLEKHLKIYINNIIYIKPSMYQLKVGPQSLDSNEDTKNIGDPGGFCAAWCLWYVDNRIKYNSIKREFIIEKIITQTKIKKIPLKQLIRNYSKNITYVRDKLLHQINIDINDWANDNYNNEQFNTLVQLIIDEL